MNHVSESLSIHDRVFDARTCSLEDSVFHEADFLRSFPQHDPVLEVRARPVKFQVLCPKMTTASFVPKDDNCKFLAQR